MKWNTSFRRLLVISVLSWLLVSWWHRQCVRPDRPEVVAVYVDTYRPVARELYNLTGVPPAIPLAVGGLESGWGRSELAKQGHNHFGIKARGNQARYCLETTEYFQGKKHRVRDCFRAYPHAEESYLDFAKFLISQPRYDGLFRIPPDNLEGWAYGLQEYGYATDPHYARKLMRVSRRYKLDRL